MNKQIEIENETENAKSINLKLGKRLNTIAKFVIGNNVADVGCDHGKVLATLLLKKQIKFGIATDISLPSVLKAKDLLNSFGIENFQCRVGDGLLTIKKEDNIDCVVIAGMGGMEIVHILKNHATDNWKAKRYVLQAQKNIPFLRNWLINFGFQIVNDIMVKDSKKFYSIIVVRRSTKKQVLTKMELEFGFENFIKQNLDFLEYIDSQIKTKTQTLNIIPNNKRDECEQYLLNLSLAKQKYKEIHLC